MTPTRNTGKYKDIVAAHKSAIECGWIVRIGYEQKDDFFWIEYIGRAK